MTHSLSKLTLVCSIIHLIEVDTRAGLHTKIALHFKGEISSMQAFIQGPNLRIVMF